MKVKGNKVLEVIETIDTVASLVNNIGGAIFTSGTLVKGTKDIFFKKKHINKPKKVHFKGK